MGLKEIKGDFLGGLTASLLSLPVCLGLGIWVFSQLGSQYSIEGALAGITGIIFASLISSFIGGTSVQISGPTGANATILVGFIASLNHLGLTTNSDHAALILSWLFFTSLLAAIFQFIFGILKLGQISKYTPYPVVIGFLNGVGLLMIFSQIPTFLGFKSSDSFSYVLNHLTTIQPFTLLIGIITLFVLVMSDRYIKKIPSTLISIVVGTLAYYLINGIFLVEPKGAVIGEIPSAALQFKGIAAILALPTSMENFSPILELSVLTALVLALAASLQSLLSSLMSDISTGTRHDSNRELVGQGIGNIVVGAFGGIFSGGIPSLTQSNFNSGGTTRLSGMICGLLMLVYLLAGWPFIAKIPLVVIYANLIYIGYNMIDKKSWIELFKKEKLSSILGESFYADFAITTIVMIATVSFNLIIAIGIGVAISIITFLRQVSRSCIRSCFFIDQIPSRVRRTQQEKQILLGLGKQAEIFQLQGPLFFASVSYIAEQVESALPTINYVVLDMRHIVNCDITGLRGLQQLFASITKKQKYLLFSCPKDRTPIIPLMKAIGIYDALKQNIYETNDLAIEWIENQLLSSKEITKLDQLDALENSGLFKSLTEQEVSIVRASLFLKQVKKNESIIISGEIKKDLYVLLEGKLSVYSDRPGSLRVIGLSPGSIFGEIAFLTEAGRTANVIADADGVVAILSEEKFAKIKKEYPSLALKLAVNLLTNVAQYLKHSLSELNILESL